MGFDRQTCLKRTGIMLSEVEDAKTRLSFQQELAFYRNILRLTKDPLIGLKLGEPFPPQRYGLYGYALLSAPTLRHALSFAAHFGELTFTFFTFEFSAQEGEASFAMSDPPPIAQDLIDVYLDRDMSACMVALSAIMGSPFPAKELHLAHDGHGREREYRDHFGCEVVFRSEPSRVVFSDSILDKRLPQTDPRLSQQFEQQCRLLIERTSHKSQLCDEVQITILARPGEFPDIDTVAQRLHMSTRTLRRRLKEEGRSYRELMDDVRFGLAKEYLLTTNLNVAEVSVLVGYNEPGSFSHAFRRWSGHSPRAYRERHPST